MKRTLTALVAAATIAGTLAVSVSDADAQWRRRGGWGWGPGIAAGIIGGAIITGAIIASRPRGYVVYEGYGQPVQYAGCYWAAQPVYDPIRPRRRLHRPAGAGLPWLLSLPGLPSDLINRNDTNPASARAPPGFAL